jgi:hypothetical protein
MTPTKAKRAKPTKAGRATKASRATTASKATKASKAAGASKGRRGKSTGAKGTGSKAVAARKSAASRARANGAPERPYGYLADPPDIERRKSPISGWGVFTLEAIAKNKRIVHYAGERITSQESTPREERYLAKGHIWCFKLHNRAVIDAAVGGNVARFINHACKPNCYTEIKDGTIWIRAGRSIRKGEELTYNYWTEGAAEIPCRCRPDCQGML